MPASKGAENQDLERRAPDALGLLLGVLVAALAMWAEPSDASRAALALIGALTLAWPLERATRSEHRRTRLIVLLALVSVVQVAGPQTAKFAASWNVRIWNVYHYYLGAKYFEELGYTGLYDATLRVDRDGADYWGSINRVRNLETYQVEARSDREHSFEPGESFTPERWEAFRRDVEALSNQRSPGGWRRIFTDRGYNASPAWTVLGKAISSLAPADRPLALKLLCSLDLLLLAATFALLFTVFGVRRSSIVLLLLTISPVNLNRFVGGFLQYDWFCAVAAALCFYRLRRPVSAAGLMAYAVLTRIFPLLFVASALIPAVRRRWTTGRWHPTSRRFLIAFSLWCSLGFSLSLFNGRGLAGWDEFRSNITTHREHHLYGERRVGLQFLFTHRLGSLHFDETVAERQTIYERQESVYAVSAAVLIVGFLLVVRRRRPEEALLLGLVPVFAVTVSSRYYWSYLALLPLLGGRRGALADDPRWLGGAQLLVFAGYYLYDSLHGDPYSAYIVLNLLFLVYFVFILTARTLAGPSCRKNGEPAARDRTP
ncbi:MAG: hypothetical protein ACE5GX_06565 [Thermoanaerobaculia bacterium]